LFRNQWSIGDGIDYTSKYQKGQGNPETSKTARRARNKAAKRAKYNPEIAETTHETKERLDHDDNDGSADMKMKMHQDDDDGEEEENVVVDPTKKKKKKSTSSSPSSSSRIEALRAKLQAKLAEKRGHRPVPLDSNSVSKRAARRAEKQRRKQEAMANAKKRGHAKLEHQKKTYVAAAAADASPKSDLATLDFGRLTGLNNNGKTDAALSNKSLANLSKAKNLEKMLADAEAKKERLEQLKKSSNEEDKAKAESMQWGDVLKEAQGDRVKDDPAKLRKAMKRKLAKKEKSRKAWASRTEQTKQNMDAKQAIRKHNLEKRKLGGAAGANLSKKRIVEQDKEGAGGRRGKGRAGFEGKKQGFLNDKKGGKPAPSGKKSNR